MENLKGMPLWYGALWALLGLALVAAGYRLMRLFARLAGAVLFGAAGLLAAAHFQLGPWPSLGIAAGSGVLGFLAGNALYYVNVSLNGAAAGYVLASAIGTAAAGQAHPVASIAGMLLGGLLAVCFERPIGIFGTSVVGGALVSAGLLATLAAAGASTASGWLYGALLTACAVGGSVLQARTTRDLPPSKPKGEDRR
jgi:hypothetical protein